MQSVLLVLLLLLRCDYCCCACVAQCQLKVRAVCSSACQALMLTNMLVPARYHTQPDGQPMGPVLAQDCMLSGFDRLSCFARPTWCQTGGRLIGSLTATLLLVHETSASL
jgi:hypothetical protein